MRTGARLQDYLEAASKCGSTAEPAGRLGKGTAMHKRSEIVYAFLCVATHRRFTGASRLQCVLLERAGEIDTMLLSAPWTVFSRLTLRRSSSKFEKSMLLSPPLGSVFLTLTGLPSSTRRKHCTNARRRPHFYCHDIWKLEYPTFREQRSRRLLYVYLLGAALLLQCLGLRPLSVPNSIFRLSSTFFEPSKSGISFVFN